MTEETQQTEETQETTEAQVQTNPSDSGEEEAPSRPDWLPEKFETPEQLVTSYGELEKKFHSRRDDLKNEVTQQVQEEINKEALKGVPESAGDYEIKTEVDGESVDVEETPMTEWFRSVAHKYGLSQKDFANVMQEFESVSSQMGPDWNEESKALGEHAEKRLERVDAWASTTLSKEAYQTFAAIPANAAMVKAFEELMEASGEPKFNMVDSNTFQEELSEADLKAMQADPKYWKDKDQAFIQKVRSGFNKLALKKHGTLVQQ